MRRSTRTPAPSTAPAPGATSDRRRRRWATVLAAGVVVATAAGCAAEDGPTNVTVNEAQDPSQFGITVTGVGRVKGRPDTLVLTMGVSVKRPTVAEALDQASASADRVLAALRDGGVVDEDLQTRDYSINQEFVYPEGAPPVPDGFRVTSTVEARLRDLDAAGEVIDAAVRAGGDDTRLQGIAFDLEEDTALLAEARTEAFEDALARAERLAELSGSRLGPPEFVSEGDGSSVPTPWAGEEAAFAAMDDSARTMAIESGQVEGTVQVVVRFPLEGARED